MKPLRALMMRSEFRKPPVDVGLPLRDLEPLSTNKLRGIVTIKVQAGAT